MAYRSPDRIYTTSRTSRPQPRPVPSCHWRGSRTEPEVRPRHSPKCRAGRSGDTSATRRSVYRGQPGRRCTDCRRGACNRHNRVTHSRFRNRSAPTPGRSTGRNRSSRRRSSRRRGMCPRWRARQPGRGRAHRRTKSARQNRLPSLPRRSNTSARSTARSLRHRRTGRHAGHAADRADRGETGRPLRLHQVRRYTRSRSHRRIPYRRRRPAPCCRQSVSGR